MRIVREAWTNVAFLTYGMNVAWTLLLLITSVTHDKEDFLPIKAILLIQVIPSIISICMGIMIGLMVQIDMHEATHVTPSRRSYGAIDGEWPRAVTGKPETT